MRSPSLYAAFEIIHALFRIFDPGVGSPNLIQRVRLVGLHHFRIIRRLLDARENAIRQAARGLKSAPAS